MIKRSVGTVLALLTLAACSEPATVTTTASSPPTALGPSAASSPSATIEDCGTFTRSHGDELSAPAARCLIQAARAGHPARLRVTSPTVEGDLIPVTYTVSGSNRVEVITDSRQDGFGEKIITRRICTEPSYRAGGLDFTRCSEPTPVPG